LKIEEVLKSIEDNEIIFVGSKTSWFFIGTKADYEDYKQGIDGYLRNSFIVQKNKLRSHIENRLGAIQACVDAGKYTFGKNDTWCEDLKNDLLMFLDCEKNLKEYVPISEREVLETYDGLEEGTMIKITGEEGGRYWLKKEFDEDHALNRIEAFLYSYGDDTDIE